MSPEETIHCPHCGQDHPADLLYCPVTGLPVYREEPAPLTAEPLNVRLWVGVGIGVFMVLASAAAIALILIFRNNYLHSLAAPTPTLGTLLAPSGTAVAAATLPGEDATLTPAPNPSDTPQPAASATPAATITSTAEPWQACDGAAYLSHIHVGDTVKVAENPPLANRVRSRADLNAAVLGYIQPGQEAVVLDGPGCANNWVWWQVRAKDSSLTGWTAEGDDNSYWLLPVAP